jgi:hypothetical protein
MQTGIDIHTAPEVKQIQSNKTDLSNKKGNPGQITPGNRQR